MGVIMHKKTIKYPDLYHYEKELNKDGTEKHVTCEGARYHVTYWDSLGAHCSEKNCEVNKK